MAPDPISARQKLAVILPLTVVNTAGYLWLVHHPLSAPRMLPVTALDRAVPFLPWTTVPYVALLLSDLVLPLLLRDRAVFHRAVAAYGVAIGCNFALWALFPSTIVRPPAPVGDSLGEILYRLLAAVDGAANCFPSGHVTIPAVACWALALERPRWAPWIWSALLLASLSILTTKQHYLLDLPGGLATAAIGVIASRRLLSPRSSPRPAATTSPP
jgi:hypothetical protein